jgi:hypothetical protein
MGRTVDKPSAVERKHPSKHSEIPRHPGVFIPQIHRPNCRDDKGQQRHQKGVISEKICDRVKPYLPVNGKLKQHTNTIIIHCTYDVGETGSSWHSFTFLIFYYLCTNYREKRMILVACVII